MKKIYILLGCYGCGKTELALHLGLDAAKNGSTLMVDLDMVNAYFRLSERKAFLAEHGISLIAPNYATQNIEALSLPATISSAFHGDWDTVIFDTGGNPEGAGILGRFHTEFVQADACQLSVLHVLNVRRPLSTTLKEIRLLHQHLAESSRLSITGLINNTNLSHLTTVSDLLDGHKILGEVATSLNIPVMFTAGKPDILSTFLTQVQNHTYVGTPLEIQTHLNRNWESFSKYGV